MSPNSAKTFKAGKIAKKCKYFGELEVQFLQG
jgi:hypothetical protein